MLLRIHICTLWCIASIVLQSLANPQPYDFGIDVRKLTRRDDTTDPIVVRRLPTRPDGTLPLRMEVRSMRSNKYKWDLFTLALSMFQFTSQDDPLSWYQVAGKSGLRCEKAPLPHVLTKLS